MNKLPILNFESVNFFRRKTKILKDVSFYLESESICGLVGVNGAGKTTIMNCILGLCKIKHGQVTINGISQKNIHSRDCIAFLEENMREIFISCKTFFNLMLDFNNDDITNKKNRLDFLIKWFSFPDECLSVPIKSLSIGQRKLVLIIGTFLTKKKFYIFDEPTNFLDPIIRERFYSLVKWMNKNEQATFLISSHNLDEIEKHINYYVIVNKGQVIESGKLISSEMSLLKKLMHNFY